MAQPCRVPAGAAAGGGRLRKPSPGRAAAWQRRPKTNTPRQESGRRLCSLLVPTELSCSSPGLCPRPSAPPAAAAQHGHPLPRVCLPSRALPFGSSFISFHTITLSSINAIGFPHAPPAPILPPPLVREFFGPRDPVFSWMQGKHRVLGTVGGSHPAPARYRKKTHKVRKDPTNHLSQQCTLVFVH